MKRDDLDQGQCPCCGGALRRRGPEWVLRCVECGLWRSTLGSSDGRLGRGEALDEARRADGLRPLREANSRREIELLSRLRPLDGARILDVGSGHGWFLDVAAAAGARAEGLEPDGLIAKASRERGLLVSTGYFPEGARQDVVFDVISFHDVLEHIQDVNSALSACRERLVAGGLLVVVAPDAGGALFLLARILAAFRLAGPLERLWQRGYPSPHVSYFDRSTLTRLASRNGFRRLLCVPLPSFMPRGLWARIHMDRSPSPGSAVVWLVLLAGWVALRLLPSDQLLHVFERPPGD